jgi:tRNA threonylcarbamoyl adenosine modification protein YeaZ
VLVLALDTSTPATSVALVGDDGMLDERIEIAVNRHGELVAPLIDQLVRNAGVDLHDIDVVAVGVGPGPFTGLRVGLASAISLGDALGVPTRGVCSLDAVAFAADRPWAEGFVVATDARRKEIYWARYAGGARVEGPHVDRPSVVGQRLAPGSHVVGSAAVQYAAEFADHVVGDTGPYPSAAAIARLALDDAWSVPVRPMYLRRPDARPPGAPKRVTPA